VTGGDVSPGGVLQVGPVLPWLAEELRRSHAVEVLPTGEERERFLAERGGTFRAVVTTARVGVDAELMRRLPALGAIIHFGVGYDTTDVEEAAARHVQVSNTPDVLTDCVADRAVGALIDVLRGVSAADRFVRRGDWQAGPFPLTAKVTGKRVGIVGLGRIGTAVAQRLEGFGTPIGYHNRRRLQDDTSYEYFGSALELARWCDALVVTAAGGPETRGLVSGEVLDALGPEGYLVNVSRGTVVDETALVDRLTRRALAGAALDVFVDEPNVPEELLDLENVVLLPHVASGTVETREAMARLVLENLARFLSDGTLVTPVP
jgi:lactate dehydrogenase-like 2-hydroxyacid dehydrogenase